MRSRNTYHRDPEEICVGNGSIELIRVFCQLRSSGEKNFFVEQPTFGEYDCLPGLPVRTG